MNILEIRTLRGPNYWSGYWKKLIIIRLDIGDYEQQPTDKIEGFYERMKEVMPSLETHGCSYQEAGGFYKRVEEGTWAGHVIEHFALEIQTLAGMDVGYGRTATIVDGSQISYNEIAEVSDFESFSVCGVQLHILGNGLIYDYFGRTPLQPPNEFLLPDIE